MKRSIIALGLLLCAVAHAQTVWRCGSASGVVYSDTACTGGQAVAVADPRSAAEVQAARGVAARERALAQRLAASRRHGDAARPVLIGIESLDDIRQRNAEASRQRPSGKPFVIRLARPAG
jgi:hypothetical protein